MTGVGSEELLKEPETCRSQGLASPPPSRATLTAEPGESMEISPVGTSAASQVRNFQLQLKAGSNQVVIQTHN